MPGGGASGATREEYKELRKKPLSPTERLLSNLDFTRAVENLKERGLRIELADDPSKARIPFEIYDSTGVGKPVPKERWEEVYPPDVLAEIAKVEEVIFSTSESEDPSYWRQVNPDTYKEDLPGYRPKEPGYVHEMSSVMAKAYITAAFETGDPVIVDGTGTNAVKVIEQIKMAKTYGYRVSLVFVSVPLTINHIRNATRERNVHPKEITRQWGLIRHTFAQVRTLVDKSRVLDAREDEKDAAKYRQNAEKINTFIASKTEYPDLYSLIADHRPDELRDYGKLLSIKK
jgi:predicted kinase